MRESTEQQLWGIVLAAGEGIRVRSFLQHLCGGRGIKQFCAVIGRRSLLQHTLARVERLIPRERILIVVSADHQQEVTQQLAHWPPESIIYQPANRDTAAGILLPLAHLWQGGRVASVAVFPSDHFILEEERFMAYVEKAVAETQHFPEELILLGMTPDEAEEGYGWIEPAAGEAGRETRAVRRFWEKPSLTQTYKLLRHGALWNTFVCVTQTTTLWEMMRQATPDLYNAFAHIRLGLRSVHAPLITEHVYESLRAVNFSSGVCERLASRLRVLPVPEVGWSDWGSMDRILASLQRVGKLEECLARLRHRKGEETTMLPLTK
jgi:mannose-1-phosphate guanylyltransferase